LEGDAGEPPPKHFGLATLRNHTPAAPAPEPKPRPAPVKRDAEAAIRQLLGDQKRRGFKLPDQEEE
jgi:hypothetical protein